MSLRSIQIQHAIDDVSKLLLSSGKKPSLSEVLEITSDHFSKTPPGNPLNIDLDLISNNSKSDADDFNTILLAVIANLGLLYEVADEQLNEIMTMTTAIREKLKLLSTKRRRLQRQVNDYMLSIYNSDGYFLSVSDTFESLDLTDTSMTSAYVDVEKGILTLPMLSHLSTRLSPDNFFSPEVDIKYRASIAGNLYESIKTFEIRSPFRYAVDGLTNTAWEIHTAFKSQTEVVCELVVRIGSHAGFPMISKLDLDPLTISPVKLIVSSEKVFDDGSTQWIPFGAVISTSVDKFSYTAEPHKSKTLKIQMVKNREDYIYDKDGVNEFRYLFGIKDLNVSYAVYDSVARFVSEPLTLPDDIVLTSAIDTVSLTVEQRKPPDTDIKFYVAENNLEGRDIDDFFWRPIDPIVEGQPGNTLLHFEGGEKILKRIDSRSSDVATQKIALDSVNEDLTKRNPSRVIFDGLDVYRLVAVGDSPLEQSLALVEGINMTRIYHKPLDQTLWFDANFSDETQNLSLWKSRESDSQFAFGRIDGGDGFFYGGDVGESARSVYVETLVDVPEDMPPIMGRIHKVDDNAKTWNVKAFLNGRDIATLHIGTHQALEPWVFKKGLNHIVLLIDIPPASQTVKNPFSGTLELFDGQLPAYGQVRLDKWTYVDAFHLQWNHSMNDKVFSIVNNEIISLHEFGDNLQLEYSKETGRGPNALRIRADLSRGDSMNAVSPVLESYRLRFSYG